MATNLTTIKASALTPVITATGLSVPKISTITYPGTETATDTAGGETINLTGTSFQSGCTVLVSGTAASVVTFISDTQISFAAPALSAGTYVIYVINPDGGTAIAVPGISYSGIPTWSTSAGSLGSVYETTAISSSLSATGDAPITYSLASGTLPTGSSLTSGGLISGTAPTAASATTYNFTIQATDAQNQTTNRSFSLTINPDLVTWSTPANGNTYSVFTSSPIANVTMSATSAAGGSITYTANSLPTGLSISGANIAGTPTVATTLTTELTATSSINSRTATRIINWVITVASDTYFKNTTLLLNGETTNNSFITDASTNSFGLTINGDTKPVLFNPYQGGYYSNYFNGSIGDYISIPNASSGSALAFGTGDFTMECWAYSIISQGTNSGIFAKGTSGTGFGLNVTGTNISTVGLALTATGGLPLNTWTHIAFVRISGTSKLYINGVVADTSSTVYDFTTTGPFYIGTNRTNGAAFQGYISNMRVINGTGIYTNTFTPSTTPLTAISGTQLLTCQSNRFIDNSSNAFTLTLGGTEYISPAIPFTANSSYSTYGSAYFDGNGDGLSVPNNNGLKFGTGDFTIEFWLNDTVAGNYISTSADLVYMAGGTYSDWGIIKYGGAIYWQDAFALNSLITGTTLNGKANNRWMHLAVVRSSGVTSIYYNGVLSASAADTKDYQGTGDLKIGYNSNYGYYTGYIANLRIVKGTALYTTTFTPPTSPLTAITNTQLLTLQYNGGATNYGIIDNSNFNNIITRAGNATQGTFSPYSQTGWSNYFDGTGDYLTISSNSAFAFGTSDFTIEGWILPNATASGQNSIVSWITNDSNTSLDIQYYTGNVVRVGQYSNYPLTGTTALVVGQWTHFAITRASNILKIWINGTQDATTTFNTNLSATNTVKIGYNGYNDYFNGYISNLRIIKGTALYTTTFTPSTTPLTAIANTSLLTCQSNRFIDNSSNNFALTKLGDVAVQAYSPFGGTGYTPSLHGGSCYFDGTGDYLNIATSTNFGFSNGDFTIDFWAYPTSTARQDWVDITDGTNRVLVYYSGTAITFYSVPTNTAAITGPALVLNQWYHIALSKNAGSSRLFVNGVQVGSTYASNQNYFTTSPVYIGKDGGGSTYITGYMSDVRITKGIGIYTSNFVPPTQTLTNYSTTYPSSLLLNFTNGGIIDQHSSNVLEALGNAQVSTAVKKYNTGSIYFDGSGDYLYSPSNINYAMGTGDFTIEFWYYPVTHTNTNPALIGNYNATWTSNKWTLHAPHATYSNKYSLWVNNYASGSAILVSSSNITDGAWVHIAISRSGNTWKMFINGTVEATRTSSVGLDGGTAASMDGLYIGANFYSGDGGRYINAYIDDLRITKGYARYTSNFTAPSSALITK
jgi:hypothetical protein